MHVNIQSRGQSPLFDTWLSQHHMKECKHTCPMWLSHLFVSLMNPSLSKSTVLQMYIYINRHIHPPPPTYVFGPRPLPESVMLVLCRVSNWGRASDSWHSAGSLEQIYPGYSHIMEANWTAVFGYIDGKL